VKNWNGSSVVLFSKHMGSLPKCLSIHCLKVPTTLQGFIESLNSYVCLSQESDTIQRCVAWNDYFMMTWIVVHMESMDTGYIYLID